jgi:hypothetical protein
MASFEAGLPLGLSSQCLYGEGSSGESVVVAGELVVKLFMDHWFSIEASLGDRRSDVELGALSVGDATNEFGSIPEECLGARTLDLPPGVLIISPGKPEPYNTLAFLL